MPLTENAIFSTKLEAAFCQTRVMLSFFSLFFVRWVYLFRMIFSELRYFNKIL